MKKQSLNQSGVAHLALVGIVILVAVIAFTAGSVYNNQQKRKIADRQAELTRQKTAQELEAKEQADEAKKTVEVPAAQEEQKPAPAPAPKPVPVSTPKPKTETTITKFTIPTTSATVGADSVVLTAKLDASRSGTCEAMVKWTDGSNAQYSKATFAGSDTCSVTVPRANLAGQNSWKFYMYYYNDPKNITIKGSSGGNVFSLE